MRKNKFLIFLLCLSAVVFSCFSAVFASTDSEILEKEPIDVVIKYIDLTDPKLCRKGLPHIKKDEDNDELKYSVRSILKNIPWIRKIYIVMPNEKVRYFKDSKSISDKIEYIRDKDVLGFDSESSITFEFNFWKLKKFGVSDNFIYMNDDYFIGKPLKKSDFFYVQDGKVVPYILYDKRIEKNQYDSYKNKYEKVFKNYTKKSSHSHEVFVYRKLSSIMFLYEILGKDIFVPFKNFSHFPHNALGENLDDLKEVYDVVKEKNKYAYFSLEALKRDVRALQHQTFYNFYVLNKYNRKVNRLNGVYIDIASAPFASYNVPLFCINTGGNGSYSRANYAYAKVVMNRLFPHPTCYEKPELNNGTYVIESALEKGKVMDIESASNRNGANLRLWEKNGTNAQKFRVRLQSDGTYILVPLCSNKRVDVREASKQMGTNIWQYSRNGSLAQRWYLIPAERGYFYIVSACNNLCADVESANSRSGTNIRCWEPNGTNAQKFKFVKA